MVNSMSISLADLNMVKISDELSGIFVRVETTFSKIILNYSKNIGKPVHIVLSSYQYGKLPSALENRENIKQ